jgi:hypothetical protein
MESTAFQTAPVQNYQPKLTLKQIVKHILNSGKITAIERNWFHRATLAETPLDPDELAQIRQVFDRLQMGLIKVVD